ncbi:MAG: helicase HerA-like domain-containing protein [Gammaproteobacteria bacterium]
MDSGGVRIGGQAGGIISLPLRMANRHGLISGATGTGKTVTLQVIAEGFARAGVPVFMADVKGDLSGIAAAGAPHDRISRRIDTLGLQGYTQRAYPILFWDLFGRRGHPIRATVSDMGPLLLANLLELNDTQTSVLHAMFKIADDQGLLLLDMKDLRAMLTWVAEHAKELQAAYGNMNTVSIAAIQRSLLVLEQQGAGEFFGEPQVALADLMQADFSGNGVISVLDATALMTRPRLYAMFLLWLIAELFEQLPEVGDPDKPRLVFFFDEAHLLFDGAPRALVDKIEQVVRLIRSKGVGVYFVTQSPLDIPEDVLGQLGNRVQHALRAFTPKDQKAVRAAAETFRAKDGLDTARAITELGVGEALVSVLDAEGRPTPVERALICPPESRIGPLTDPERAERLARSPLKGRYEQPLDRVSAYEALKERADVEAREEAVERAQRDQPVLARAPRGSGRGRQTPIEAMAQSAARAIGSSIGRQIVRGVLGSLLGKMR